MCLLTFLIALASMVIPTEPKTAGFQAVDNPESGAIEISYLNNSDRNICFLPENWPNKLGRIDQASRDVFLRVDGVVYPMDNFNSGYPGGLEVRVRPGRKIVAQIPYSAFNLPKDKWNTDKILTMNPYPRRCSR